MAVLMAASISVNFSGRKARCEGRAVVQPDSTNVRHIKLNKPVKNFARMEIY
jgi:hypothetical protein